MKKINIRTGQQTNATGLSLTGGKPNFSRQEQDLSLVSICFHSQKQHKKSPFFSVLNRMKVKESDDKSAVATV